MTTAGTGAVDLRLKFAGNERFGLPELHEGYHRRSGKVL